MPKSKSSKSSMKAIQAELAALNKQYAANKKRIAVLQERLTPELSHLAQLASERHPIPHMDTHVEDVLKDERFVRGASGALTSFQYPAGVNKPAHRVHVNLTPKPKGGRSRKHKVRSQRRRKSSRRNH